MRYIVQLYPILRKRVSPSSAHAIPITHNDLFYTQVMLADIVVFDGLDELDALGPYEILRRAGQLSIDFSVRLVTHTGQPTVCAASGLTFATDGTFVPGEAEIVIVAGGGWNARSKQGAWAEYQKGELAPLLVEAATSATVMAGVCTGTMLWAHAGVITGRRANTQHTAHEELAELGVRVVPDRVVDDGDLVTSGGVTSGLDLALWLVARELSDLLAQQIAKSIEYKWFRPNRSISA
jgi:transcriptional regulator GlxA family with amidase domain